MSSTKKENPEDYKLGNRSWARKEEFMQLLTVKMDIPEGANLILGHSHFIKTVEDLYEILVGTVPDVKFGLAFSEASGECLIRVEGNDPELVTAATNNAQPPPTRWKWSSLKPTRVDASWGWWTASPPKAWRPNTARPGATNF
jgi:hypothetical protein